MIQIIPFSKAQAGLAQCKTSNPIMAMNVLRRIQAFSDLARAFKESRVRVPSINVDLSINPKDTDEIEQALMNAVDRLFPIDEDLMYANLDGGESLFDHNILSIGIIPAYIGYATTWDEIAEALSDTPMYSDEMSVPIFLGAYFNSFDKDEWKVFHDYFGWGVDYPKQRKRSIILADLYKRIDECPECKFDSSFIQASLQDTGLVFFDLNPYEADETYEFFPWDYNTLMKLAAQWKEAQKIVKRIPYNLKVSNDPNQLKLLLKLVKECERK